MKQSIFTVKNMTKTAMIAGLYAAITFATFYMSFGAIQYRVSEALTILPVFTASAIPGLSLGCALANLLGAVIGANPVGLIDAVFGTAATFLATLATYWIGKRFKGKAKYFLAPLPPVLINAVIVGWEISFFFVGNTNMETMLINAASVLVGQAVVCYGLGVPLMLVLERKALHKRLFDR